MKRTGLILIGLTITILINGQTIKLQGGTSISKLNWELKGINVDPFYHETLIDYSIFVGLDFFEEQYFNLSSSIGMIRKGGKSEFPLFDENLELIGQIMQKPFLDYLSINTTIDLKYELIKAISPFLSFGPRLDYLINSSNHFDSLKDINELKKYTFGLIIGVGLRYDLSKFHLGLRSDYYYDFTKIADWTFDNTGIGGEVTANTYTINLTLGYRLR